MKKTVLVTGATGFIGSHLVKRLVADDYQVVILKRSFSDTKRINDILPSLVCYDIDFCGIEQPFQDLGQVDAVVHLATFYSRGQKNLSEMFETNLAFPIELIKAIIEFGTNIFFNTDTYFSKGKSPYSGAYSYSMSKQHFRSWGEQFALNSKIAFANVSIEHPFGAGDYDYKLIPYLIKQLLNNVPEIELTSGEQKRDFVHVDDVVSAYALLIDKVSRDIPGYQQYELGTGKAISLREFIEMAKALTNAKTELKFGALPLRQGEIMSSQADLSMLNAIEWKPEYSLENGLEKTISWYSGRLEK